MFNLLIIIIVFIFGIVFITVILLTIIIFCTIIWIMLSHKHMYIKLFIYIYIYIHICVYFLQSSLKTTKLWIVYIWQVIPSCCLLLWIYLNPLVVGDCKYVTQTTKLPPEHPRNSWIKGVWLPSCMSIFWGVQWMPKIHSPLRFSWSKCPEPHIGPFWGPSFLTTVRCRVHHVQGSRRLPSLVPLASPSWASLATQWSWSSSPSTTSLWVAAERQMEVMEGFESAQPEKLALRAVSRAAALAVHSKCSEIWGCFSLVASGLQVLLSKVLSTSGNFEKQDDSKFYVSVTVGKKQPTNPSWGRWPWSTTPMFVESSLLWAPLERGPRPLRRTTSAWQRHQHRAWKRERQVPGSVNSRQFSWNDFEGCRHSPTSS